MRVKILVLAGLLPAAGLVFYLNFFGPAAGDGVRTSGTSDEGFKIFTAADGRFSFEYPDSWDRTEIANLETAFPQEFIKKYDVTVPFVLVDGNGSRTILSILRFEKGGDLNAVMDSIVTESAKFGQVYEELHREEVGGMLVVDSVVTAGQERARVRDLLIGAPQNTVYDLSFTAAEDLWNDYAGLFQRIQNSVELTP